MLTDYIKNGELETVKSLMKEIDLFMLGEYLVT
jgi:hypothetical protein